MPEIFITGDKHGELEIKDLASKNFSAGNALTKDDFVIILGDFGLLWGNPPSDTEKYWLKWLSGKKWTTFAIDGNHENFDMLDALPVEEKWGAPVGIISHNIYHLKRGYVYEIAGKKIFTFGGAMSTDREGRIPGKSWWERELPNFEETERGFESLENVGWNVDWVWTHTAPKRALEHLFQNHYGLSHFERERIDDPVSRYLDKLAENLSFSLWSFGHFHVESRPFDAGAKGLFQAEYRTVRPLMISERMKKAISMNDFKHYGEEDGSVENERSI